MTSSDEDEVFSTSDELSVYRGKLIGEWFRNAVEQHRKRTGLPVSQADLARLIGVTPPTIGVYMNDCFDKSASRTKLPGDSKLRLISEKLGADFNDGHSRRYARLNRYGVDPPPVDSKVLTIGDVVSLYRPDGRKVRVTQELLKRLDLEAELQDGRSEE